MSESDEHAGEANRLDPREGALGFAPWPAARLDLRTVAGPALTEAIQDYLKAIYKLQEGEARVSVTALAREQRVAAGSASEMVKKLAALELVDHAPYKGIRLTPAGERVAVEVIRHHRLLELYLAETLGVDVDDVHDEADRLRARVAGVPGLLVPEKPALQWLQQLFASERIDARGTAVLG